MKTDRKAVIDVLSH